MIITVFRSRLTSDPASVEAYKQIAIRMTEIATSTPGHISHKRFVAEDGERVTIIEFESEEAHLAFASHPEHRQAQALGRSTYLSEYDIKVCEVKRSHRK